VGRLVKAETAVLESGGCCVRLAGLYNLQRGAHNFWLTSGKPIAGPPSGVINLLHYDDAAGACLAALKAGPLVCQGKSFLISDGHPMSRKDICESALLAQLYKDCSMPTFSAEDAGPWALGKVYRGEASNEALQWTPKYASFNGFMKANAQ
jgi:nucleoside-diphosphate-sugar epimerase